MTTPDGASSRPEQSPPQESVPTYPDPAAVLTTAGWGRRIVALFLDWWIALAVSAGFFHNSTTVTLAIFAIMQIVLVATAGFSIGHFLTGLRVERAEGGWAGPRKAVIRTLLLCLVVPVAVIQKGTGRGLHDVAAGTVITHRSAG